MMAGVFEALHIRNFRLFFFGQLISVSGTWMQGAAQSWLVLSLTGSGAMLGLMVALQTIPVLLGAMFGGVIADRFSKRELLIASQAASAVQALLLGLLVATGVIQVWMVAVLGFTLGCINAVDIPTRHSFVAEMVGPKRLTNAVSLTNVFGHMGLVVGPAIGGVLIATAGFAPCFLLNAVSYLGVISALLLMNPEELRKSTLTEHIRGEMTKGIKYALGHSVIRTPFLLLVVAGMFAYEFQVTLPLLARFTFSTGSVGFGALNSCLGAGAVVGGLLVAARVKANPRYLAWATLMFGISLTVTAVAPSYVFALVLLGITGAFSIFFSAVIGSSLQLASAPNMRGRVMSLYAIAFTGTSPIGGPAVGWVGQTFGARWSLAVGGIAVVLAALVAWRSLMALHRESPLGPAMVVDTSEVGAAI
jgi:MFS family permease